jgi:AcrR family transcriptional regulator
MGVSTANDAEAARQAVIVDAAYSIFLRYGFKKTTMDDVAKAVGISRQALYLHFPTKEALFKAMISRALEMMRTQARAALAHEDHDLQERLLGAFAELHGKGVGVESLGELIETTATLLGPVFREIEKAVISDVARVLDSAAVAARWKEAGLSAKDLAEHLSATSGGLKYVAKTPAEYLKGMRIAVRIVCWGPARDAASRFRRSP